ncbi:MAG: hypothetical protein WD876_01885 [Candidatus Pacearchaeota archaeon]
MINNTEKNQSSFSSKYSIFPKSRKGDIATMILVIGIFLVCAVALFSFVFFSGADRQSFSDALGTMAKVNLIAEQARFYENAGIQPESMLDLTREGNYYNITVERKDDDKRKIYIKYLMPIKTVTP